MKYFKIIIISLLNRYRIIKDRIFTFVTIPSIYKKILKKNISRKSKKDILLDLLILFFQYKLSADCYFICRLWSVDRSDWKYYFGSNYREPQKSKLEEVVQPRIYSILFADKYICQKLCESIGAPTPKTFGVFYPDQDYRGIIFDILNKFGFKKLFIKPLIGRAGQDIAVAEQSDEGMLIRTQDKILEIKEFKIKSPVIFQEAVQQHLKMSILSSESVNTIRVVTIYTKEHDTKIVSAFLRCGVGQSYIDNWSAGGIAIEIDIEKGELMKYGFDKNANIWEKHPTSGIIFEGFQIPNWDKVIALAKKVQQSFVCYKILGLDIAIDKQGKPIIIEINDYPDLMGPEQNSGALLKRESNLLEFGRYGLLINKYQKRLYMNLIEKL